MKNNLIFIAFFSLIINLYLASKTELISDTFNFYRVGKAFVSLENPYLTLKDAYPYPPLSMFISGLNYKISQITGWGFPFVNRIIPILSFILLGLVIFSDNSTNRSNFKRVLLYFFNPLIILVNSIIGQNDIVVLFLLTVSLLYAEKKPALSGLLMAISSLVKIYPVLVLPFVLYRLKNNKEKLAKFLIAYIILNLCFWTPFLYISLKDMLVSVFRYKGFADFGWGGVTRTSLLLLGKSFISAHLFTLKLSKIGLIGFFSFYLIKFKRLNREKSMLKIAAIIYSAFLIMYPNISVQYLIWVLPFYFFYKPLKTVIKYTIFASLAGLYFFLFSNPSLLGIEKINTNLVVLLILQIILYVYSCKLFITDYCLLKK